MISDQVSSKSTILAATYIIILFTVFFQGCSIEFLVRCLNIALDKKDDNFRLFNAFNKGMVRSILIASFVLFILIFRLTIWRKELKIYSA